jgi:hypothetical protein
MGTLARIAYSTTKLSRTTASGIPLKVRSRNLTGQAQEGMFSSSHFLLRIHFALIGG